MPRSPRRRSRRNRTSAVGGRADGRLSASLNWRRDLAAGSPAKLGTRASAVTGLRWRERHSPCRRAVQRDPPSRSRCPVITSIVLSRRGSPAVTGSVPTSGWFHRPSRPSSAWQLPAAMVLPRAGQTDHTPPIKVRRCGKRRLRDKPAKSRLLHFVPALRVSQSPPAAGTRTPAGDGPPPVNQGVLTWLPSAPSPSVRTAATRAN